MKVKRLIEKTFDRFQKFDVNRILPYLSLANEGAIKDVVGECPYYRWLPCLIEELKPKQILELGGAMGVGDICMLSADFKDFKLYSVTLEESGLEFSYIEKDKYPNFFPVVGNDLDLSVWPKELNLSETDLWFLDSEHTEAQLRAELGLYQDFFKKGTVLLFDDIHLNSGMNAVWDDIPNILSVESQVDLTLPLHWSGFGLVKIK